MTEAEVPVTTTLRCFTKTTVTLGLVDAPPVTLALALSDAVDDVVGVPVRVEGVLTRVEGRDSYTVQGASLYGADGWVRRYRRGPAGGGWEPSTPGWLVATMTDLEQRMSPYAPLKLGPVCGRCGYRIVQVGTRWAHAGSAPDVDHDPVHVDRMADRHGEDRRGA